MPEYEYICLDKQCNNEWCETHSIKADPQKICPACNQETAKRLISGGSGKGIVNLTGQDLVNKVKADAKDIERNASRNENFASNFIGENLYAKKQQQLDNAKKNGTFRRSR